MVKKNRSTIDRRQSLLILANNNKRHNDLDHNDDTNISIREQKDQI